MFTSNSIYIYKCIHWEFCYQIYRVYVLYENRDKKIYASTLKSSLT